MEELIHGGDIYSIKESVIDFSANINPLGIPDSVKTAVKESVERCIHYPDPLCRRLCDAISQEKGVRSDQILCGNGAADLIFRLALAIRPHKAVIPQPTFAEYEQSLSILDCAVVHYFLRQEDEFRVTDAILPLLTQEIDLLFLCNPNNPTGWAIEQELLLKILEVCRKKGIVMVLDECFHYFLDCPESYTLLSLIDQYPNLFVLRAFTKLYALPGLRLGYGACSDLSLLKRMRECGQTWSVSIPAQEAGVAALQEKDYVKQTLELIRNERRFLKAELEKLGFQVFGSQANYLFFQATGFEQLKPQLIQKKILIRSCENYLRLDASFYRVAVRSHQDNFLLVTALKQIVTEG